MPKAYSSGAFQFILRYSENGVYYYDIIHSSGRYWDYNHPFTSVREMDDYAHSY